MNGATTRATIAESGLGPVLVLPVADLPVFTEGVGVVAPLLSTEGKVRTARATMLSFFLKDYGHIALLEGCYCLIPRGDCCKVFHFFYDFR